MTGPPRDVTQVAGTVIYSLRADAAAGGGALASLTPARPRASVPVTVSVASCSGHARGETKKPYAFLVWLGPPGGEQLAVTPASTRRRGPRSGGSAPSERGRTGDGHPFGGVHAVIVL